MLKGTTAGNKLQQIFFVKHISYFDLLPKSPFPRGFLTTQQMTECDAK